jgi:hypothetical protein
MSVAWGEKRMLAVNDMLDNTSFRQGVCLQICMLCMTVQVLNPIFRLNSARLSSTQSPGHRLNAIFRSERASVGHCSNIWSR